MQYWVHKDKPYRYVTVNEFSEAFQSFHIGHNLGDELATPFQKTKSHPAALTTKTYGVSKMELLKSCFSREVLLMKKNCVLHIIEVAWVHTLAYSYLVCVFHHYLDSLWNFIVYSFLLFF